MPSVTSVDYGAFSDCYWLKNVDIPNLKEFTATDDIDIEQATFYNCLNLVEVDFPNVEKIEGERLFEECNHLKKVSLPKTQNICKKAFWECSRLTDIYIPNAQFIEDYAFAETYSLTEITLPSAVEFGNYVFRNSSLKTLNAPMLETIGEYCFTYYNNMYDEYERNTSFGSFNAPKLETAFDYAFAYTGALTKLELPSLTDLGKNAFFESSVSYFDAPKLKNTSSLPTAENSIAILSSEFSECSLDATGYDLTVYGTYGTYAETYANQYKLTFVGAPVIVSQPASIYSSIAETLETNAVGVNLTYQWYGTDSSENLNGTAVEGATNKVFDPTAFESYPYYYCIVTSTDGDYIAEIKTDIVENSLHFYAADYSTLEDVLAKIPTNLSIYTDESVTALNDVLNSIDRNLNAIQQKRVDEYVIALTEAIENLQLKPADFTALDEVLSEIPEDLSIYTDESVAKLKSIEENINRNLDITLQEQVNKWAEEIREAISKLEYKGADYTIIEAAKLKAEQVGRNLYTPESLAKLDEAIAAIDYNLTIDKQSQVEEIANAIEKAISELEYKSADYSAIETAKLKAEQVDRTLYTPESLAKLDEALAAIDYNLTIDKQSQVEGIANTIEKAISELEYKGADYSSIEKALAQVPSDLSIYTEESVANLKAVEESIDRNLDITNQEKISEYVEAIRNAIEALEVKPADYSAVDEVLTTLPASLSIYTDESVAKLNDVLNSIDKNLDVTQQAQVDEYVITITNAVAALELKSADYAELEKVLKTVPDDLSIYTDNSSAELKTILAEIDKNLDITNQEHVDKWAEAIPAAVKKLVLKPANYSALEKAIATIPSDLSVYTEESVAALQEVIDSIDYSLDITQQKKVDEYVEQLNDAVNNLEKECWFIRFIKAIIAFFNRIIMSIKLLFN